MNRASIQAQLTRKKSQLEILNTTYDKLVANPKKSFSLDTGDGRVSASHRDLDELQKQIDIMERKIDFLERKLGGGTVMNFTVRRRIYGR